jgi:isocitrate/isopropylmalate dehydrogenase
VAKFVTLVFPFSADVPVEPTSAIERVTADKSLHARDLGGSATTRQVTDAIVAALHGDNP